MDKQSSPETGPDGGVARERKAAASGRPPFFRAPRRRPPRGASRAGAGGNLPPAANPG